MSKNSSKNDNEKDYYSLKTDAVDRLVNAKSKSYEKKNEDPGKDFRSKGFLDRIPAWIKAVFIKFWFSGAVCFFILWGLGLYIWGAIDMIVILGIVMGMVTDLLINNAFRFLAVVPDGNNKWMMFPKKKLWTFFANILYGIVILGIMVMLYAGINIAINNLSGTEELVYVGVEPILFGILYVVIDTFFIKIKHLFIRIINDAKEKAEVNK